MELGIDKQRIEALRGAWTRWTTDPVTFRLLVCLLLVLGGGGLLLRPQALALAKARKAHGKAEKRAHEADELVFYTRQAAAYTPRLFQDTDLVAWQQYVLDALTRSGARMRTLEPKKTEAKGVFRVLELELNCTGTYAQLVDFIDRLERGERVVRVERLRIERRQRDINLELVVKGLVKGAPSADAEAPAEGEAPEAAGTDASDTADADADAPSAAAGVSPASSSADTDAAAIPPGAAAGAAPSASSAAHAVPGASSAGHAVTGVPGGDA